MKTHITVQEGTREHEAAMATLTYLNDIDGLWTFECYSEDQWQAYNAFIVRKDEADYDMDGSWFEPEPTREDEQAYEEETDKQVIKPEIVKPSESSPKQEQEEATQEIKEPEILTGSEDFVTFTDLVLAHHNQARTTSVIVAQRFKKKHKNVLQSIENLDCSSHFARLNFQPTSHIDEWNREQPMYYMTRDGFMFLVMGFTGKEAAMWKERFIEAFNLMEQELKIRQQNIFRRCRKRNIWNTCMDNREPCGSRNEGGFS